MIYILVNSDLTGVEERVTCDTPGWPPSPPHLTCPPTGENYHQHNQRNFSNQSCLSQNNLLFSLRDIPWACVWFSIMYEIWCVIWLIIILYRCTSRIWIVMCWFSLPTDMQQNLHLYYYQYSKIYLLTQPVHDNMDSRMEAGERECSRPDRIPGDLLTTSHIH